MKNRLISLIIKHEYLFRLIMLICLVVALPFLSIQYITMVRTYEELKRQNNANYAETAVYFNIFFNEQIRQFEDLALQVRVDKKIMPSLVDAHPWYRVEAIHNLQNYANIIKTAEKVNLYFKNTDTIITSEYAYTVQQYIDLFFADDTQTQQAFRQRLVRDTPSDNIIFSVPADYTNQKPVRLFFIKPIVTGYALEHNATIFCELSDHLLSEAFSGFQRNEKYGLAIISQENLIYANDDFDRSLMSSDDFISYIRNQDQGAFSYLTVEQNHRVFKSYDHTSGLVFIIIIPERVIDQGVEDFYQSMRLLLLLLTVGSFMLSVLAIYVSYKPIMSLVKKINSRRKTPFSGSELKTIEHTIDDMIEANMIMSETVTEQRLMLMDAVLGSILYGVATPAETKSLLDESLVNKRFICLVVHNLKLKNLARDQLTQDIMQRMHTPAFVTDIPHDHYLVIICAVDPGFISSTFADEMRDILSALFPQQIIFGLGHAVDQLEQIRNSYLQALIDLEKLLRPAAQPDMNKQQVSADDDLIAHFLQCVQNGYTDDALERLEQVFAQNTAHEDLASLNYSCYELLVLYKQSLQNLHIDREVIDDIDLICFDRPQTLKKKLSASVIAVCDIVNQRRQSANSLIKKQIAQFVDRHYTASDITLDQVSDQFSLSVYTCSRFFKEYTGIGFKEYIIAKRMELAKELLLTSRKNIYEVAGEVGFESSSYFVTCFKANFGVSPAKFRQTIMND